MKAKQTKRGGFALIATLTLMMLLGLIAVGILSVASRQNRIAAQVLIQAEARQQALMGLDAAIAELQIQLGPDQRVTAYSGILSEEEGTPQHVLGVWNSWEGPIYAKVNGQSIQSTYTQGRSNMFRRWLVSSTDPRAASTFNNVNSLVERKSGERVCLVGEGTLGTRSSETQHIYADLVSTPASGNNEGCFAWWIGGENQKANVAVKKREETDDPIEALRRTWDTPTPIFYEDRALSSLANADSSYIDKLLTLKTISLMTNGSSEDGIPYFYDATIYSYSLPTNVRDGGLKHDLNLLLNKPSLEETEFARRTTQDCPIAEGDDVPQGTETQMPIGSWQVMHAYYNTWPKGGESKQPFVSRLQGTPRQAYSLMSGDIISETTDKGDKVTYYDTRTDEKDEKAGYARTPVLMAFMGSWGLQSKESDYKSKGNAVHYVYSPMVMWWNPYNVQMRVGAKKLWVFPLPYRTTCVQAWDDRIDICPTPNGSHWSPRLMMHTCESKGIGIPWQHAFRLDWGNYFINSEEDESNEIVFEPGEIVAFTLAGDVLSLNEVDSYGEPQEFPFIVGDHPERMTHFRLNFQEYVNLTDPNAAGMYNFYIGKLNAKLKLEHKSTPFFTGEVAYGLMTSGKQADYFVTMGEVRGSAAEFTDEKDHVHVSGRDAFALTYGYDGLENTATGDVEIRRSGQVDRFNGAEGISPNAFLLGWYDYETVEDEDLVFMDQKWAVDMFGNDPVYYVSLGIVPKSYNRSFNEGLPLTREKDYRTKSWQHSSPAFWGSALLKPDEQQRQYHPYQLAVLEIGTALNRGVLDTVNSRNGVFGITSVGGGGGESVSFISCMELPLHPPFSLAGFAGMRLTPGWYETSGSGNEKSFARARRTQYQAGVPGVGIGNSFADPCLPADDVYVFHESPINSSFSSNGRLFSDFFDHALLINDALWDRWFCSSVSDMPQSTGGITPAADVLSRFVDGEEDLPVARYKLASSAMGSKDKVKKLTEGDGWKQIARYLVIHGGFNVNSISVSAWEATLLGLSKRDMVHNAAKGELQKIERRSNDGVLFSRFMVSTSSTSIDNTGTYSPLDGSDALRPELRMCTAWGEVRELSREQIHDLAVEMVKKVRERGPFLNMSDFINRRLDGGSDTALTGALQAAIDATDINSMFMGSDFEIKASTEGDLYRYPKAEEGSMYTAAPGYLIQSDVLMSLGNILTVRDDTFVVRAYGCVRTPAGTVLAQSWCEAVVQRTIDYVDPTNEPEDAPATARQSGDRTRNSSSTRSLSNINSIMGRRFRIVAFRWLDVWDI